MKGKAVVLKNLANRLTAANGSIHYEFSMTKVSQITNWLYAALRYN